jgi:hypothetical protein
MAVSARLKRSTGARLTRFCRARGISKTEAIEQGLQLLLEADRGHHPAYLAYLDLKLVSERKAVSGKRSSAAIRAAIRAKYPG